MLLKSIKVENIRSYENQKIEFPEGSLLLAGDIGAGKSTILLAIEFAIFGAKKGELPAYTLLKHGKKEGSVELKFEIENKEIIIKRFLRKGKLDIKQEAGYIITNGLKKDATTEELRAITLNLLGYPKDLVKKGKDLIFRYTVYTPQEDMKRILYERIDTRLDTLRKVFNIDKYKRIQNNSKIIISALREKKRSLDGFILDLDSKLKELEQRNKEIIELKEKSKEIEPRIIEIKLLIKEKKKSTESIENDIKELIRLKKELSVTESDLLNKIEQNNRLNKEIKTLEDQILSLKSETKEVLPDLDDIKQKIKSNEEETVKMDFNITNHIKKIREFEVKINHSQDVMKKISSIEKCPLCEQNVEHEHKDLVNERENKKINQFNEEIEQFKKQKEELEKTKENLKTTLKELLQKQNTANILKIKLENLKEKTSSLEQKTKLKDEIKTAVGNLNTRKTLLQSQIENFSKSEEKYEKIKEEIEELLPQERFLELEKKEYETKKESIERFIERLEKEIQEKKKSRRELEKVKQYTEWLSEFFVNLMGTMEKHVMVSIHNQFNELFKEWFNVLIEDESLNVRLDEDFTPLVEQDGYETYIENLSGGEKTSVALSYRLALNKVINEVVSTIKTKDLIILDEPTDGFSTEQLDKVRDILNQLKMKQIIIVSHEGKIESFVDNIIRIEKHDNLSSVV